MSNLSLGFVDCEQECVNLAIKLQGQLPSWLRGIFLRNGPAKFHAGQQSLNHWFDGFAMLQRFHITPESISYSNRYIQSEAFLKAQKLEKNCFEEFATLPQESSFGKIKRIFHPLLTDNTNVNVSYFNNQWIALTETCRYNCFDANDLTTIKQFQFDDKLLGLITTAHPHYDFQEKALYNFNISIGLQCYYCIYKLPAGSKTRQLLAKIPTKAPAYTHTFAITKQYIILIETPLRMQVLKFMFARQAFIKNYKWEPKLATQLTVIDKQNGQIVCQAETDPFFMFHQINAFEQNDHIMIDLSGFTDSSIINSLYLENICSNQARIPNPSPKRLILNLNTKSVKQTLLADCFIELPSIYYSSFNAQNYQFTYGCSKTAEDNFLAQLIKIDVKSAHYTIWREPDCYPGEPIFVANPHSMHEDDGVILSVILNTKRQISFLLILDAKSFTELARAELPYALPFGLHGQFVRDTISS